MTLTPGTRLGPYEIVGAIGAGTMGEVYRARDTLLNRDVAIKVLPELVATDTDRLARFTREARALASLNHPNIAIIHGLENFGSSRALIMELVDGEDLSDRIARGPIPIDEALPIAQQIAAALQTAHETGIVHRDLKPANVKVGPDGAVKVLDFGLAKELGAVAAGPDATASPTLANPAMTQMGAIIGTAAYMAPEQAKGRPADKRSDIWAFGAVLYEMLTGRRAFDGEDLPDTLATVLKGAPDWSALPPDVPPHIRSLIQRCLAKDRRQRIADMSVALFVMSEAVSFAPVAAATGGRTALPPPLWRGLIVPVAAALLVGAAVGPAVWLMMRPTAPPTTRFAIVESGAAALSVDQVSIDLAITRDGTRIVYKGAGPNNDPQLFVRALNQLEPTLLPGLGRPRAPFFSPDGEWIGYVEVSVSAELKKVAVTGGPSLPLCRLDSPSRGVAWGDDDAIIFATSATSTGLQSVSSAGGEPRVLTIPNRDQGEADHWWPQFLPGSQAVLFTITPTSGGLDASQIAALDLRTGAVKKILRGGSQAQYLSGHLVYTAARTLRAVRFDLERLEVTGTPVPVLPQVVTLPNGTAEFDIARDSGTLVYVPGDAGAAPARTLVWVDRQGREEPVKGAPVRAYTAPRLSPDGTRIAVSTRDQEDDIWVWDFSTETLARVTSDPGIDHSPVWMPDGRRVVFGSQAGGVAGSIFSQSVDGGGTTEQLTKSPIVQTPSDVSRDGGVVFSEGQGNDLAIMLVTTGPEHRVKPLLQTPFIERNGEISPDGRWLAYQSNESGQNYEVSVRPLPGVDGGKWQVSREGGTQPSWARNSEELFYRSPDGAIMSVPVGRGTTWMGGLAKKVVEAGYYTGSGLNVTRTYDVSADGRRFLMIKGAVDKRFTPAVSIVVVQNWLEDLKRLVPSR